MTSVDKTEKIIVSISGGLGSAETLKRAITTYGASNIIAIFADVKGDGATHFFSKLPPKTSRLLHERYGGESRDTYRFIWRLAHHFDIPIHRVSSNKTIFTVFAEKKALRLVVGNGIFFCPASEELKRTAIAKWIKKNIKSNFKIALGMGWDEEHRRKNAERWWTSKFDKPIEVITPNALVPYADNITTSAWLQSAQIEIPSAYGENFEHNNCGSGCVQAGQTHWANVYNKRPDIYMYWAFMEWQLQQYIGKYYTIMKNQRGGVTTPMSLYEFIPRIESGDYRKSDGIACGCFTNPAITNFLAQAVIQPKQLQEKTPCQ